MGQFGGVIHHAGRTEVGRVSHVILHSHHLPCVSRGAVPMVDRDGHVRPGLVVGADGALGWLVRHSYDYQID